MGTQVRDAIISALSKKAGEFFTPDEIAKQHKLNPGATGGAARVLVKKGVLRKRKREGGREIEYAAGPRISFGEKYAGRRFPFHRADHPNGDSIPAANGGVGIVIKIDGTAHAITLSEAKGIFTDLKALFS